MGQKQKTERKKEKERRAKVGNNNGKLRIANATSCGARKAAWANIGGYLAGIIISYSVKSEQ